MKTKLDELFEDSIDILSESLSKAVRSALEEYERLNDEGGKAEAPEYIYISFLLSGILCKLPWMHISLCDEHGQGDMTACFVPWDTPVISNDLYRSAEAHAGKIKDYELEQLWVSMSGEYIKAFERFLPIIIKKSGDLSQELKWHFGQYLIETAIVWEKSGDEVF